MVWRQSDLRRLDGRLEELIGGTGEMRARLGTVWVVPGDCAPDAEAVRAGLAVLELPLRRLRRGVRRHLAVEVA